MLHCVARQSTQAVPQCRAPAPHLLHELQRHLDWPQVALNVWIQVLHVVAGFSIPRQSLQETEHALGGGTNTHLEAVHRVEFFVGHSPVAELSIHCIDLNDEEHQDYDEEHQDNDEEHQDNDEEHQDNDEHWELQVGRSETVR